MSSSKRYVYIASPYTNGDVAMNVRNQMDAAEVLMQHGFTPYIPTLAHFHHMIHPHEYEYWMRHCLAWVLRCDCVLRLPGDSVGADREVQHAIDNGIPVYYSIHSLIVSCC